MKSYPRQLHVFFNALTYYTRFSAPSWVEYSKENQAESTRYLPWIGLLIGFYTALIYWLGTFIFPDTIAVILSIATSIWMSGALHEDGLSDCFDGFGGGWEKQRILNIMKDSRLGSYGVLAIILALMLKYNALLTVQETVLIIISAHCLSRFFPLLIIHKENYVGLTEQNKAKVMTTHRITKTDLIIAFIPALLCLVFSPLVYISVLVPLLGLTFWLASYFRSWIDGYTGDCLGCCQQLSELTIYIWFCLPWFIG
ncbi:adenosylcobinamide-GDP ribazoletransferase [Neptuniibacter marinus]|uniref:adenosylcobinamide-GDP ribazoletransferase n=1 Tax=Neptuniibacter marinus TaxID=1806670 RepID=UPI00082C80F2|nr:adenosylcobinamide-GDP ribazoletransferase [Neptuniibacter marinus]